MVDDAAGVGVPFSCGCYQQLKLACLLAPTSEGARYERRSAATFFAGAELEKRNAEAAYNGIFMAYGDRCRVKNCRMDGAPELNKACRMRRAPFEASAPYVHQSNGLIESHNRNATTVYGKWRFIISAF